MNIGIIGGGSIGLLFGAYIAENNHQVTIYTRTIEQATLLENEGITKIYETEHYNHQIKAKCISNEMDVHDLVIVAVKQYHLESIFDVLTNMKISVPILFVQNGMSHIDFLKRLPQKDLLVGVVEHGAQKTNGNTVLHSGGGITKISKYKGNEKLVHNLINELSSRCFPIIAIQDWYDMLISKVVVNAMINPLTAMLRVENGQLIENPHFYHLFKQLFDEIVLLLCPKDPSIWWDMVVSVCSKTAKNRSSMLRDIEQSKPTEIESILGYFQTHQNKNNSPTPIIDFLYYGIKGLEK